MTTEWVSYFAMLEELEMYRYSLPVQYFPLGEHGDREKKYPCVRRSRQEAYRGVLGSLEASSFV